MSTTNNPNAPLSLENPLDEDRVRRALGLKTSGAPHQQRPEQARQRHRFVADGAVPVVMLNRTDSEVSGLRERLAAAEHALEHERAAHAGTRRSLHDAQAAHQALQTRFGHTELSHQEALATERNARRAAEEAVAALKIERDAALARIASARVEPARAETPRPEATRVETAPVAAQAEPAPARAPRRERKPAAPKEQKPIRWWTPSYRAKKGS